MNFLERVIEEARPALPLAKLDLFYAALRHSLMVDPVAYTPASFDPFGFEQRELYDLRVLLLRPLAYEFLTELQPDLRKGTLDRKTSLQAYQQKFGRDPLLISVRPKIMMLTYSEWLQLTFDPPPALTLLDVLQSV
jgi:hypothetical protein